MIIYYESKPLSSEVEDALPSNKNYSKDTTKLEGKHRSSA
jgi:hypothetical protein